MKYGFTRTLSDVAFADARRLVEDQLAARGLDVVSVIDVQAILEARLGLDVRPHVILNTCHPELVSRALALDPRIGLLLPCNVVIRELSSGEIEIAVADLRALVEAVGTPELGPIADDAERRMLLVLESLA
jgi:uncharacterized protein (DUF302 family)